jgi:hypothetical protein
VSIPVELSELVAKVEAFGPVAYVVSVRADGRPHVVAAAPTWDGGALVVPAGRTTAANVGTHPTVTLLWAAPAAGDGYSLIVDGTGAVDGEQLRVEPTSAVLHRTPAGDPDAPSCITVLGRT